MITRIRKDKILSYTEGNRILSIKQARTEGFIKKGNHYSIRVKTKMPTQMKELAQLYGTLDISDLEYIGTKHLKNNDKYGLNAIRFAMSNKSEDSEIIKKMLENRYYGNHISNNCLDGETIINDNDIQD